MKTMSLDETIRERIVRLLKSRKEPLTVEDIIILLDLKNLKPKDVYEHLRHVAKTVRAQGNEVLAMIPPSCKQCGFIFTNLDKPKKPSRCPKCKSERITSPAFKMVSR
ncbi:MAG: hypothetical protein QW701_06595 [Candidatus Nezhaarchaeales archaeon]